MCTLLFWREAFGEGTASLAANRDEALDRPFDPPRVREVAGRRATWPRDHRGGTWLGRNAALLVAITNAGPPSGDPARPSRGLVARDALGAGSVEDALAVVSRRVASAPHDGFNLLVAGSGRGAGAVVATHADGELHLRELAPGLHVLDNRTPGARHVLDDGTSGAARPGAALLDAALVRQRAPERALRRVVRDVLASHEVQPVTGHVPCRHPDPASGLRAGDPAGGVPVTADRRPCGHGTACAAVLHLDAGMEGGGLFLFAAGPPCRNALERVDEGRA